jgi:hypothetical protein
MYAGAAAILALAAWRSSGLVVPFVLLLAFVAAWVSFDLIRVAWWGHRARRGVERADEFRRRGLCVSCGYDLTGNVSGVCPECGTSIKPGPRLPYTTLTAPQIPGAWD